MRVHELIRLLEGMDSTLHVAVGDYKGPHNGVGWNETHERSHGPIWVAEVNGRVFVGINCFGSEHKNETYRTIQNGHVVTVDEYYRNR